MNHQLLEIIAARPDFKFGEEDRKILDFFVEYMDHSSLYLFRYDAGNDPSFIFTNDAQHFTFTMTEIREHYNNMKSGVRMNWEEIPFEYISKEK